MKDKLPYASSFQDLIAYRKSVGLADKIFLISKSFPKEETYSLTDQIRRSSRSVGAHLAEAWGKRRYLKLFSMILTGASAELYETIHWIDIAYRCNYISEEDRSDLLELCYKIKSLIGGIRNKASLFSET